MQPKMMGQKKEQSGQEIPGGLDASFCEKSGERERDPKKVSELDPGTCGRRARLKEPVLSLRLGGISIRHRERARVEVGGIPCCR